MNTFGTYYSEFYFGCQLLCKRIICINYICIEFIVCIAVFTIIIAIITKNITSFDPHHNSMRERHIPLIFIDDET